ncbi:MAG: hypothetical protein IT435_04615 [Phycisphaerales bacterium]|nr:hypothetical protein [Phycisphaerales bacterium]
MDRPRPGEGLKNAQKKFRSAIDTLKDDLPDPPDPEKAIAGAKALAEKIRKTPISATPIGSAMLNFLQDLISKGKGYEDFEERLERRAREELKRHKYAVDFLTDAVSCFSHPNTQARLMSDVVIPARSGQISANTAWSLTNSIVPRNSSYPILSWVTNSLGKVTFGIGLKVEAGLAIGGSSYQGLSGMLHQGACFCKSSSVGVGAIAEAEIGVQVSFAPDPPASGWSITLEVSIGGGAGVTVGYCVSLRPTPRKPTLEDPSLFSYEFDSVAVSVCGGGGLDLSISVAFNENLLLFGPVTEGSPTSPNPPPPPPRNPPPLVPPPPPHGHSNTGKTPIQKHTVYHAGCPSPASQSSAGQTPASLPL